MRVSHDEGKWRALGHGTRYLPAASSHTMRTSFNVPEGGLTTALMQSRCHCKPAQFTTPAMDYSCPAFSSRWIIHAPPSPHSAGASKESVTSLRAYGGRRWDSDHLPSHYYSTLSYSTVTTTAPASSTTLSAHTPDSVPVAPISLSITVSLAIRHSAMLRLRHRMSSRRGGTRGQQAGRAVRPPSVSNSSSSAPDYTTS